jgi:EAL domain-containing protein (putative c-di-GMP-specific phosphodiesterase class I)/ABC-type amino acid transport substrate-binding protein/GGDEF domain-containing protein
MDDLGRRSGYAYEYAQKVAVYANWKYEYIEGSWPELMEMLAQGKIDVMSDVSYKKEREEKMLFSSLPMGSEEYYLFTTPGNKEISPTDYSTFNGKKVGVNKGSIQADYFREWIKTNKVDVEIVELMGEESENIAKLLGGKIDMYLSFDAISSADKTVPVCKIASSEFYFAVNKARPDILSELNSAMNRIQEDNRFYNHELYEKYLKPVGFNRNFSTHELAWLEEHKTIRVGYQDNYLAFCAKDPKTGELIGALKDYLEVASKTMDNFDLNFEPVGFSTSEEALEALKNGDIDCMFPINLTDYYGETKGFSISSPIMNTEMLAIVSSGNQEDFFKKERVTVAVNAGNPNYDMFLLDNFPEWRSIYFKDTKECLKAVSEGKADCVLVSTFRYNDISNLCSKYDLVSLPAGVKMDYCFAVNRRNSTLYSVLNRVICVIPETTMSVALSRYALEDTKSGFFEYIRQNKAAIVAAVAPIVTLIIGLILFNMLSSKKARERQKLIMATETDKLTKLYIKSYFYEYANRMYNEDSDIHRDAIVINIIQFHSVNAIKGREFGDLVLASLGEEILDYVGANEGIAGYSQADTFAIYCAHIENYRALFNRLQSRLDSLSPNATILIRMGVKPWQKDTPPRQLFEQALIACNMARGHYKERLIVFDDNMRRKEEFEQQLLNDLRSSIDNMEFEVYYQPKFDIRNEPPKLCGAEALVRWEHPKYGMISPDDFIPLFERHGQIGIVDNFVWRQAVAQVAKWKEKHGVILPVSINLSKVDVFDSELEKKLDGLLSEYSLDSSALRIEVTETAYAENAGDFIEVIENLRHKGYKVDMDDFGTGYSSLNMLSSMPIDALKMDKAFINDIDINNKQTQLIELILDIAEDLKIPVIAEGVETKAQLVLLQDLGCEYAQGYYFSKPLPVDRFETEVIDKYAER